MLNDARWLALIDSFQSAALDDEGWYPALREFAAVTGSHVGELICVGPQASVPVNIMTDMDPAFHDAFVAAGGGDPEINPRIGAGMKAPILKSIAESDFITPDEYRRNAHYQEIAVPWNIPFICATVLDRSQGMMIGLAVARSHAQGHISSQEREIFESLAPHVRSAVRVRLALEGQGAALLTGALDALSMPAFVCDHSGAVQALTPAAEDLVAGQRGLQLRGGRLLAVQAADAKLLQDAIDRVIASRRAHARPLTQTVLVRGESAEAGTVVLDVIALPHRAYEFSFSPRVLIVARGERGSDEQRALLLRSVYALTVAETDIAMQITSGVPAEAVAAARGVSLATVRTQIKSIMAKVGVNRQVELAAALSRF